jgi:ubiquinone/menaquinone biosynthesis C-methylase UbiE
MRIDMSVKFENYLKQLRLEQLLTKLGASRPDALAETAQHFTMKEAEKRDEIVLSYFGRRGITRIIDTITERLLEPPQLPNDAKILDVGAGSGFFTVRIAKKMHSALPTSEFYAMDLTPAMLLSLAKKKTEITPFVGIAENIKGSVEQARAFMEIPRRFDAVFSTLMLHHSTEPEKVFSSVKSVLKKRGKAVVVDLCEHGFEEFRTEMGDVHLGFKPESVRKMAQEYFDEVRVGKIPGICCESSGRSAEILVVFMKNLS